MTTERTDVLQEITQVVIMGAIGLGVLCVSAAQIIALWPRFIKRVEADLTNGLLAAFRDATVGGRGH
jgi:hypothetical protein